MWFVEFFPSVINEHRERYMYASQLHGGIKRCLHSMAKSMGNGKRRGRDWRETATSTRQLRELKITWLRLPHISQIDILMLKHIHANTFDLTRQTCEYTNELQHSHLCILAYPIHTPAICINPRGHSLITSWLEESSKTVLAL